MKPYTAGAQTITIWPDGGQSSPDAQQVSFIVDKDQKGKGIPDIGISGMKLHVGNAHAYTELKKEFPVSKPRADDKSKNLIAFGLSGSYDFNVEDINLLLQIMVDSEKPKPEKEKKSFWDKHKGKLKLINYLPKGKDGKPITSKKKQKAHWDKKKETNKSTPKPSPTKKTKPSKGSVFN